MYTGKVIQCLHFTQLLPLCGFGSRQQTTLLACPLIMNSARIELLATDGVSLTKLMDNPPMYIRIIQV